MQERYGESQVELRETRALSHCEPVVIQLPDLTEIPAPAVAARRSHTEANTALRVLLVLTVLLVTFWSSPTLGPVRQRLAGLGGPQQEPVQVAESQDSLAEDLPTLPVDPLVIRIQAQPAVDVARVALDDKGRGGTKSEAR